MNLYVTEIHYEDYSLRPAQHEVFVYQPTLQLIYVYDLSTDPPEGYPYEHCVIEVINIKYAKSFTLDAFYNPRVHTRDSNQPRTDSPDRKNLQDKDSLLSPESPPGGAVFSGLNEEGHIPQPPEPNPPLGFDQSQVCTCENQPDPKCPFHGEIP